MMIFSKYNNIIFDFDGVIADSNPHKKKCIQAAAKDFCDIDFLKKFVDYYISNNGVPREIKINKFFNYTDSKEILGKYNACLTNTLHTMQLTPKVDMFIDTMQQSGKNLYILSGGAREELSTILERYNMNGSFREVMTGPKTKDENLSQMNLSSESLFIGDSQIDYEVSVRYGLGFIFMYGYTQFENWRNFFSNKSVVLIVKNFEDIIN